MLSKNARRLAFTLAAGASLALASSPAVAGVEGNSYEVVLAARGDVCEGQLNFFGQSDNAELLGDCGTYLGGYSELDLVFIGFWEASLSSASAEHASSLALGDPSCDFTVDLAGIQLFGAILLGTGERTCAPVSVIGLIAGDVPNAERAAATPFGRELDAGLTRDRAAYARRLRSR